MAYTNAQILAAVVTEWSRPAVSQLTANRLCTLPAFQQLQDSIIQTGLVGSNYRLQAELEPFIVSAAPVLVQPLLENMFSRIPDATIPVVARQILATAMQQPEFSVLDGLVTFEHSDLEELQQLIELNLPLSDAKNYNIKTKKQ